MDTTAMIGLIISLATGGLGLFFLIGIPKSFRNHRRIAENGKEAIATIVKERITGRGIVTEYTFVVNGNTITGYRYVKLSAIFPDRQIPVTYWEDDPAVHIIPGADAGKNANAIIQGVFGIVLLGLAVFWLFVFEVV